MVDRGALHFELLIAPTQHPQLDIPRLKHISHATRGQECPCQAVGNQEKRFSPAVFSNAFSPIVLRIILL